MTETTERLALPLLAASQSQKHVTHNEALIALDALIQLAVRDRQSSPPETPGEAERYIVAGPGSGAWSGQDDAIAICQDGAWQFFQPRAGWTAWVASTQAALVFDGAAWGDLKPRQADMLGISATADTVNRLAVSSPAVLFNHAGGGSQVKINKAAATDTASLLFQTDWSGRAEFGLAGSDAFSIKASEDGDSWREAAHFTSSSSWLGGYRADLDSDIKLHVAKAGGAVGIAVEALSGSGITLADFALQTELHTVSFRNEGRDGSCVTGTAPEFQVRFPPPFSASPLAIAPNLMAVDVPVRLKGYAAASLPSAASAGAGALVYVPDAAGGGTPAFSDGTNWLNLTDRAVVG